MTICTYATSTMVDEIVPASFRVPYDKPAEASTRMYFVMKVR